MDGHGRGPGRAGRPGRARILIELTADFLVTLGRTRAVFLAQVPWLVGLDRGLMLLVSGHGLAGAGIAQAGVSVGLMMPIYLVLLHRAGVSTVGGPGRAAAAGWALLAAGIAWAVAQPIANPFVATAAGSAGRPRLLPRGPPPPGARHARGLAPRAPPGQRGRAGSEDEGPDDGGPSGGDRGPLGATVGAPTTDPDLEAVAVAGLIPGAPGRDRHRARVSGRFDRIRGSASSVSQVIRRDGVRVVAGRGLAAGSHRLLAGARPSTSTSGSRTSWPPPLLHPPRHRAGGRRALVINWVTNPPSERSGGMTTLTRVDPPARAAGPRLPDLRPLPGDPARHRRRPRRRWPGAGRILRAEVHDAADGMRPAHAVFATSWPTAYVVRSALDPGRPLLPGAGLRAVFYPPAATRCWPRTPTGSASTASPPGRWLATELERRHGMACDGFDLGVDLGLYRLDDPAPRRGRVFFSRLDTPRRGSELGLLALTLFAAEHPEVEIHVIGDHLRPRRCRSRSSTTGTSRSSSWPTSTTAAGPASCCRSPTCRCSRPSCWPRVQSR